jgi:hypothetical protein
MGRTIMRMERRRRRRRKAPPLAVKVKVEHTVPVPAIHKMWSTMLYNSAISNITREKGGAGG